MKVSIDQLEKKLNINFKDKNKLIKSLTHKSFNSKENNEKRFVVWFQIHFYFE